MAELPTNPNEIVDAILGSLPAEWRPIVVFAFAVLGFALLALRGLKEIKDIVSVWLPKRKTVDPAPPEADTSKPARQQIWLTRPVEAPVRPKSIPDGGIPIVTFANMKGGVGKTTQTANVAAYFDLKKNKRVLLIDLDYQGSLSQTALAAASISRLGGNAEGVLNEPLDIAQIIGSSQTLHPALPKSRIITCFYEFADAETETMIQWINKERDEIRFNLSRLLQSEQIKREFDLVLIDAPPRFSTGAINALCASTHLVIPTALDNMSAEAVIYFSRDIAAMRSMLFPHLQLIGVVPSMTYRDGTYTDRERDTINRLNKFLKQYWGDRNVVLEEAPVPRRNPIADVAGDGIGYVKAGTRRDTVEVVRIFDRLGERLETSLR